MTGVEDPEAARREFAMAVMVGLSDHPRWLPCRFLYDERGSRLFDAITETPEYYPTRTESGILAASAGKIRDRTGPVTIVELGAGNSAKTGHLLAAYATAGTPVRYVPVDVSESALRAGTESLLAANPLVRITAVNGTYDRAFPMLRELGPAMLVFLGSTVGNFNQTEAALFWTNVASHLSIGDFVLLGVDLVKDGRLIDAAYNDAAGHSAEFTRNIFHRMNRELGAGLDLGQIDHLASYNAEWQRVEIHARFRTEQVVRLEPLATSVRVRAGERIMTEISRKFVLDELEQYLTAFGFTLRRVFTDERRWFAVLLLQNSRPA
jgi:L-histidine N-alpha-methyltransferase